MYFAGKLVYLIVCHSNQLAVKYGWALLWTDIRFNMLLTFKASTPILAMSTLRKGRSLFL